MTQGLLSGEAMITAASALRRQETEVKNLQWHAEGFQRAIIHAGFEGESPQLAMANAAEESEKLRTPARLLGLAASVLEMFAPLQQRIEKLMLSNFSENIMMEIWALGRALDFACARSIDALCTPISRGAPLRLDDFGDLPIAAIHELNLAQAPPRVVALAEANPDLYVLEVSDDTLVALIAPDDVTTSPASVTTFVEGVGSSNQDRWPTAVERARAIATHTGGPTALWLGYRAPESLPKAVHTASAAAAGGDLARFQRSLNTRYPAAKKTMIGYSYGSVVSGYAAREGLKADELLLVGSPGVGVTHVSQLEFEGTVTAVTNDGDVISYTGGNLGGVHGVDPTSPMFGAQPFPTRPKGSHTSYWDDREFLEGLRTIATR